LENNLGNSRKGFKGGLKKYSFPLTPANNSGGKPEYGSLEFVVKIISSDAAPQPIEEIW